jgi:hypothetical protein
LPVDVHVEYAARYHLDNQEQDEYPEWHSPVWWFCWVAKGHPDLNDLDGDQALDFIEHILKTRVSGYLDVWCEAIGVVREEVLDAFPTTWDEVRVPPGSSRLRVAERLATECPLIREGNIRKSRSARYLRLLNVCAWLAFMQEGRFFLARRTVAEALGCNDRHAGRVIDLAIRDGFVHRAHRYRPIERKADEYRFNLDLLPPGASDIAQRELGPGVRDQFREEL